MSVCITHGLFLGNEKKKCTPIEFLIIMMMMMMMKVWGVQ